MKITFVAMALAMLSLVGIPPFIGYISKDLALENVVEVGHLAHMDLLQWAVYLLIFITPIYGMRLIGLTFIHGGEPREVHEAPALMWAPYAVLAVAALALGVYYSIYVKFPITPALFFALSGFLVGLLLYVVSPGVRSNALRPAWEFLYRRLYIPLLYDGALPLVYTKFARFIDVVFDKALFDGLYHGVLPAAFGAFSNWARRLITGNLSIYVLYGLVGLFIFLLLVALW